MAHSASQKFHIPISERLKSIPGFFGIRLAEEPKYQVVDLDDDKEIRRYEKMTLASVTVVGKYEEAVKEGYQRLSNYLFGENAKSLEIPMTTPIFEEQNHNSWTISFILPKEYTTELAPTPLDHSIRIHERPAFCAAVIWYTGGNDLDRVYEKSAELQKWLQTQRGFYQKGDVKIAQYDGPSTLDFFRRNELQVEVAEVH
jgi:hypothetical protein